MCTPTYRINTKTLGSSLFLNNGLYYLWVLVLSVLFKKDWTISDDPRWFNFITRPFNKSNTCTRSVYGSIVKDIVEMFWMSLKG